MSNSVQPERPRGRAAESEPSLAELMDPAALERRLREARERRIEAIRAREERAARESDETGEAPAPRPAPRAIAIPDGPEIPNRPAPPRPVWTGAAAAPARPPLSREMPRPEPRTPPSPIAAAPVAPAPTPAREIPAREPARHSSFDAEPHRPPVAPARSGWIPPAPPRDPEPLPERIAEPTTEIPVPPKTHQSPLGPAGERQAIPAPKESNRGWLLAIFLIGLLGGGGAVLFAPASFRARIAEAIAPAPERAEAPATPATPAPAVPTAPETAATEKAAPPARPETVAAPRETPAEETVAVAPEPDAAPPAAMDTLPGVSPRDTAGAIAPGDPGLPDSAEPAAGPTIAAALPRELTAPAAPAAIGPPRLPERPADTITEEQAATPPVVLPMASVEPVLPTLDLRDTVETAPEVAAAPEAPEAGASLGLARISVNYPSGAAGIANDLAGALRTAGAVTANVVPVGFAVSSTNVRFYHPEDRAAAEAVAALVSAGGPAEVRDFTNFRPQPLPGVVEVWLRGGGGTGATNGGATAGRSTPATQRQTNVAAPRRDLEAEAVERQLLSREVERMLRQQSAQPR